MEGRKVLVLIDDLLFKTKIQSALGREGFQAIWSRDAADALSKLASDPPSLVILDLGLKGVDSIATIEKIKGQSPGGSVPILAYASHVDQEKWKRATAAGADKVVARSEFSSRLPDLVKRYAAPG